MNDIDTIAQAHAQAQFGELFRQVETFLGVLIGFSMLCLLAIAVMGAGLFLKERLASRKQD